MAAFQQRYDRYKAVVEQALEDRVVGESNSQVIEAMRYSLLGGGKRLRGVLALAACEMLYDDYSPAIPAAAAVEMLHCYSLIHDDLPCMDNDELRRGKPSCHIQFGEATALLAGDGLLTLAFGTLASIERPKVAQQSAAILAGAAGVNGMILGQELDLFMQQNRDLELINYNKTGRLIRAAAALGAAAADCYECIESTALDDYANLLGSAFQIIDDVLDVTASQAQLGKPTGSDAQNNKQTYVSVFGLEKARNRAAELTEYAIRTLDPLIFGGDSKTEFLRQLAQRMLQRID